MARKNVPVTKTKTKKGTVPRIIVISRAILTVLAVQKKKAIIIMFWSADGECGLAVREPVGIARVHPIASLWLPAGV